MAKVVGRWEGGRVIEDARGKQVYYIRKRIRGRLYEVSTRASTLKAALAQWHRFQENPEAYEPSGALPGKAPTVTGQLDAYIEACHGAGNSQNWRYQKRRYLEWWAKQLPGDVRRLTREKVLAALDGTTAPHNRLAALKAFCAWLHDRGLLSKTEHVTEDIPIPAPRPAQWSAPRAISREAFAATMAKVEDVAHRDVLTVLGGTGMHTQEALRLAHGKGSISETTLTIFHKNGRQHRMTVEAPVAEAVARMMGRGGFSVSRLLKAVRDAADAAGVARWAPGGLRHSVVSWLVADGASLEAVAAHTNHDVGTLKKYYNVAAIPRPLTRNGDRTPPTRGE
jgi:integrase